MLSRSPSNESPGSIISGLFGGKASDPRALSLAGQSPASVNEGSDAEETDKDCAAETMTEKAEGHSH